MLHHISLKWQVYLEPVDGAAVDKRRELPEPVSESVSDGAHSEHDVKLLPNALYEQVEESDGGAVRLLGFLPLSA